MEKDITFYMTKWNYILIPVISAAIGYITNWIAIKMLFHPKKQINFLFFKVQGLIPKRRIEVIDKLSDLVKKELVSHNDIRERLVNQNYAEALDPFLNEKIDSFLKKFVGGLNPMIRAFVSDDFLKKIKEGIIAELDPLMPQLMETLLEKMEQSVDFKEIVKDRLERVDMDYLEGIVYKVSSRELKHIEILGGVLGFVIGIIQVILVYFIG